jgi:hypothetical protein
MSKTVTQLFRDILAMPKAPPRPLREMCHALTVVNVVASGALRDTLDRAGHAQILGPASHGIRLIGDSSPDLVHVRRGMMNGATGEPQRCTLEIGAPWRGHVWCEQQPVRIAPWFHWCFRCQTCNRTCKALLWPPGGSAWRCRHCVRPRYPDKRRVNTLPPLPDAPDNLDEMQRDLDRLRLLRGGRRRYQTSKRKPRFEVNL